MAEFMSERMKRMRETSRWSEEYENALARTESSRMSGHMEGGFGHIEGGEKSFGSREERSFPGPSQIVAPQRRKSKKRKRMKDPLAPKNPLSAYLFFVVKQRSSGSESSKVRCVTC